MGVESDQEIVQLIGSQFADHLSPSLEECSEKKVLTTMKALEYVGEKTKPPSKR